MCVVSMVVDQFQFPKKPADWYTLPKPINITYTPDSIVTRLKKRNFSRRWMSY